MKQIEEYNQLVKELRNQLNMSIVLSEEMLKKVEQVMKDYGLIRNTYDLLK